MIAFVYGDWHSTVNGVQPNWTSTYHFWRKDGPNASWNHKFGRSSGIMRALYIPAASVDGINGKVWNEMYNSLTGEFALPQCYAVDGSSWGYFICTFNESFNSVTSLDNYPMATSGALDNSAAAVIERHFGHSH